MYLAAAETVEFHIAEAQTNSAGNNMMNDNCCYMGTVQQKTDWSLACCSRCQAMVLPSHRQSLTNPIVAVCVS